MLKVAPIDNPSDTREVSEQSWKHWPDATGIPGAKQGGNKIYKVVSDDEVEAAKLPKRPIVPPPVEVRNIQAGLGPDGQPKDSKPVAEVKAEPVNSNKAEAAPKPAQHKKK